MPLSLFPKHFMHGCIFPEPSSLVQYVLTSVDRLNFVKKKLFWKLLEKTVSNFSQHLALTVFLLQSSTGEDRVILTWAEKPPDLDMHLFICDRGCEVYYGKRNCENVNLDVDDTNGNGPETITLTSQMPAPLDQTYVLWVCIHSCTSWKKNQVLFKPICRLLLHTKTIRILFVYLPNFRFMTIPMTLTFVLVILMEKLTYFLLEEKR